MDGIVIVVARTGALHFARALSPRFDRRHAKSDRLNLAALLFALQNVTGNCVYGTNIPPTMTIVETAAERIVMARSHTPGLLLALFVRPSVAIVTAQSLVQRLASYYDVNHSSDALAPKQNTRFFRDACEHAIQDEVDACLDEYATSLYADANVQAGFVMVYYTPPRIALSDEGQDNQDDDGVDRATKEAQLASPRLTDGSRPSSTRKPKKNAVMHLADPKHFQRLVIFPRAATNATINEEDTLRKVICSPQFPKTLVNALEPTTQIIDSLMQSTPGIRTVHEGTWHKFPMTVLPGSKTMLNLRFWYRGGCFVVHLNVPPTNSQCQSAQTLAARLLDRIEPMAECVVRLRG